MANDVTNKMPFRCIRGLSTVSLSHCIVLFQLGEFMNPKSFDPPKPASHTRPCLRAEEVKRGKRTLSPKIFRDDVKTSNTISVNLSLSLSLSFGPPFLSFFRQCAISQSISTHNSTGTVSLFLFNIYSTARALTTWGYQNMQFSALRSPFFIPPDEASETLKERPNHIDWCPGFPTHLTSLSSHTWWKCHGLRMQMEKL